MSRPSNKFSGTLRLAVAYSLVILLGYRNSALYEQL
jgi:hypothetical protein